MTPGGEIWTSPETKGAYPVRWHVAIPGLGLQFDIATPLVNQELSTNIGPSYWEGAIDVGGQHDGRALHGVGYLEMTGYTLDPHERSR